MRSQTAYSEQQSQRPASQNFIKHVSIHPKLLFHSCFLLLNRDERLGAQADLAADHADQTDQAAAQEQERTRLRGDGRLAAAGLNI